MATLVPYRALLPDVTKHYCGWFGEKRRLVFGIGTVWRLVQAEEIRAHNQQKETDYKWVRWYFRGGISRNTNISFQWSLQVLTFSFQYLLYILLEEIYLERNHVSYIFLLNVNFKTLIVRLHIFIIFSMFVKFQ